MRAVQRSSELLRILALPRRDPKESEDLGAALTALLVKPHECSPTCAVLNGVPVHALQPLQTCALAEAHDRRGLLLQAPVGGGKTLISVLLGRLLGAQRPLLLIPASLKGDTVDKIRKLRAHWDILVPRIESYEMLSTAKGADLLERYRPDLIIGDEAHCLKNARGPRARRIKRYRKEHPSTVFCFMTGTMIDRSIRDCAHLLEWTHGALCPVPVHDSDLDDWCAASDEKVHAKDRIEPGALRMLLETGESEDLDNVRRAIGRRVFATPGAIRSGAAGAIGASLYVTGQDLPLSVPEDEAFRSMRDGWVTPDGHPIPDAVSVWRHACELALGFYYVWDPRPPADWLAPRQAWCCAVRDILTHNRRELDTEFQVADEIRIALARGKHHEAAREYQDWHAVKDSFLPNTEPRWVGDTALAFAAQWLEQGPGIVWSEHNAFSERLAELTGVPFFHRKGLDARKRPIGNFSGPCIASVASCGTGQNLQAWDRSLVASCKPRGKRVEQLLGRLHRPGQRSDVVTFDWLFSCREQVAGFEQVRRDAQLHLAMLTPEEQQEDGGPKMVIADVTVPTIAQRGWAWREQRKQTKAA